MNFDVAVEVPQKFDPIGDLLCTATPAGKVAHLTHIGPYSGLPDANRQIHDFCRTNGLKCRWPSWEVYGHWTDDPTKLQTDLYYLLQPD